MTVNWRNLHRACKLLLDYSYIFVALFGFVPYFQLVESYILIFLHPWSTWHSGIDWCIQKNLHSYLYQLFQVGNIPFRMLKQYISWGALCYLAFCVLWTSHNHSFFWLTCRIKFWEENVLISCLLNSSLIDELGRWLKGCRELGKKSVTARRYPWQPCKRQPPGTVLLTESVECLFNQYLP